MCGFYRALVSAIRKRIATVFYFSGYSHSSIFSTSAIKEWLHMEHFGGHIFWLCKLNASVCPI